MCGDDDAARSGGERGRRSEASLEQTAQRGVAEFLCGAKRPKVDKRSDRLSLKSACGLRVSRPLRAVCRRLLGVREAVAIVAGVESVHRGTAYRGQGWA